MKLIPLPFRNYFCVVIFLLFFWIAATTHVISQTLIMENARPIPDENCMGLLTRTPCKEIISLNGTWKYKVNESETWSQVRVPASILTDRSLVFVRNFNVPAELIRKSVFQFVALNISYYCEIQINGQYIGKHAGRTSFSYKLPPGVLKPGKNTISISVKNSLNAQETIPAIDQLSNPRNYCGILHDIGITASGNVWVQETNVSATVNGEGRSATLKYHTYLKSGEIRHSGNDTTGFRTTLGKAIVDHFVEILDPISGLVVGRGEARNITIETDRSISIDLSVVLPSVKLWSPESPVLYTVVQKTIQGAYVLDISSFSFGFRSVELQGNLLSLNGRQYPLKGITYVEDSPYHGRSLTTDEMERDIVMMKNLGINTIRFTSGNVHPILLSLCDRYGLLVFEDIPLYGIPSNILASKTMISSAKNIFREVFYRDSNHPCVVAWGLAQQIDGSNSKYSSFLKDVSATFRSISSQFFYASFTTPPRESIDDVDILCFDPGSFDITRTKSYFKDISDRFLHKPCILSSLSFPVEIGNYNGYSDPHSIDAQAQFYLVTYAECQSNQFAGMFVHTFADYAVSIPILTVDRVQQFTATVGVVDAFRMKRLAYDVLKAKFNNEKPPVITVGNFEPDHPVLFIIIGILLIFLFAIIYNLFRRFRENVMRSLLRPYNFYSDVRDQRMLSIFQTSMVGLIGSLSTALVLANVMYFWRTNTYFDYVLSHLIRSIWLKQWINYVSWNSFVNIIITTAGLFVLLVVTSFLLRLVAFFFKKSVLMFDAYSVTMWSVLPMVFLAPFGMILYRLMDIPFFEALTAIVFFLFHIWIVSRLLKGSAIVLETRPVFFYLSGYAIIILAAASWLISLNADNETISYLQYIFNVWKHFHGLPS